MFHSPKRQRGVPRMPPIAYAPGYEGMVLGLPSGCSNDILT